MEYFLFIYSNNCCVTAVAYLACEDVVLGYGWAGVLLLVSAVKRSLEVVDFDICTYITKSCFREKVLGYYLICFDVLYVILVLTFWVLEVDICFILFVRRGYYMIIWVRTAEKKIYKSTIVLVFVYI